MGEDAAQAISPRDEDRGLDPASWCSLLRWDTFIPREVQGAYGRRKNGVPISDRFTRLALLAHYQRLSARIVKLLTIMFLIWIAPAVLVLLAMTWSLWLRKRSCEELGAERSVLLDPVIPPSTRAREGQQDGEQGHDDLRKDDLKSLMEQ